MRIEATSDTSGHGADRTPDALGDFLTAARDPAAELEVLMERDASRQRAVGRTLKRIQEQRGMERFRSSLRHMKRANRSRMIGNMVNAQCSIVGKAGGIGVVAEAFGKVDIMKPAVNRAQVVQRKCDRSTDQALRRASEAAAWLDGVRQMETKMIDRIEALRRAEHDGNMAAIGR
jgi:hypothetical protein